MSGTSYRVAETYVKVGRSRKCLYRAVDKEGQTIEFMLSAKRDVSADSWRAAKRPVEFHLYEQGGHGFGMYPKETTSTGWFDAFVRWIGMHGMLKPAASGGGGAAN